MRSLYILVVRDLAGIGTLEVRFFEFPGAVLQEHKAPALVQRFIKTDSSTPGDRINDLLGQRQEALRPLY